MIQDTVSAWQKLAAHLQSVHDKDWTTSEDPNGTVNGVKLDSVFYTFTVDHYYRGWMQLNVKNKVEPNWKTEIIYKHRITELKKYRRPVNGDELNKAKDIARLVRRFERNGDDSMFISAYSKNQNLQMIVAELFTHVAADSITLSNRSDGVAVKIFDNIHLNYIMDDTTPKLSIYLYPRNYNNADTADKLEGSSRILKDAARFTELGYKLTYFNAEFGQNSQAGKIQMDRIDDLANFTEIYGHIKESESGRLIIKRFMTKQMGKK